MKLSSSFLSFDTYLKEDWIVWEVNHLGIYSGCVFLMWSIFQSFWELWNWISFWKLESRKIQYNVYFSNPIIIVFQMKILLYSIWNWKCDMILPPIITFFVKYLVVELRSHDLKKLFSRFHPHQIKITWAQDKKCCQEFDPKSLENSWLNWQERLF